MFFSETQIDVMVPVVASRLMGSLALKALFIRSAQWLELVDLKFRRSLAAMAFQDKFSLLLHPHWSKVISCN